MTKRTFTWTRGLQLILCLTLSATGAVADRTEWSEDANRKTKTVYDDGGNMVYQAHWSKQSGQLLGTPLDLREKPKALPSPRPLFEQRDDSLVLKADSLVRIRIDTDLHSGRNKRGEGFAYTFLDDLRHGSRTLLASGSEGTGMIKNARRRGAFGKSGRLELDFGTLPLVGGGRLRLVINKKAEEANEMTATAAGTAGAGLLVLGPIGLAGGAFIKGRDVNIPAGTVSWVAVAEDTIVHP